MSALRVVDAGTVDPWRSQALWHGIAAATTDPAAPTTLSFCRPAAAYVGLGYHRPLGELDLDACRRRGLPVIRRRIGGGPVYIDSDQLFFQVTLPAARAPARVDRLYELYLEPAAAALRALGVEAWRNGWNDLAVGRRGNGAPRKVSGTGAGRIGDGVVVVGNVLFRFPHRRMVEVLAVPGESLRRECLRLMRRHVATLESEGLGGVGFDDARASLVEAYARALGADAVSSELTAEEEAAIRRWEARFRDRSWLAGPPAPDRPFRRVKISADVAVAAAGDDGLRVEASIVGGRLERAAVTGERVGGEAAAIGRALAGVEARPEPIRQALGAFGETGGAVRRLLAGLARG